MKQETISAKHILEKENLTLVFTNGSTTIKSTERGVKPLLDLYEKRVNVSGFCVCDKVVGKGAAAIYALLGISEIYALTASESAIKLLEENAVTVYCDNPVKRILNRDKTGFCPIESAVGEENDPYAALEKIKTALNNLRQKENRK